MDSSKQNRLFTVGCSYTSYIWPGYSEFLGTNFDTLYNYGKAGAGNTYIFNTACRILNRYKPTENDTVIVQWSAASRFDRIPNHETGYLTPGSLDWQDAYSQQWVDKYFNVVEAAHELVNFVLSLKALSKQYNCKFAMFSMFEPWIESFFGEPYHTQSWVKYKLYIDEFYPYDELKEAFVETGVLRSLEQFCWDNPHPKPYYSFWKDGLQDETHPSCTQHLKFAKHLSKVLKLEDKNLYSDKAQNLAQEYDKIFEDKNNTYEKLVDNKYFDDPHVGLQYSKKILEKLFDYKIHNHGFVLEEEWKQ